MKYYPIKIKLKKYAACPSKKYLYFCWGGPALAAEQVVTSPGRVTSARATAASAGLGWAGRGSGPASPASGPRPPGHTAPGTSRSPPGEHTWHVTRAAVAATAHQQVTGRIEWPLPLIIVSGWQLDLWNDVYRGALLTKVPQPCTNECQQAARCDTWCWWWMNVCVVTAPVSPPH